MTTKQNGVHHSDDSIEAYLERIELPASIESRSACCFEDLSQIGPVESGPTPRAAQFGRWAKVVEADLSQLPPVTKWQCLRTTETMKIDGRLEEDVWQRAQWSEPFGMIHDGGQTSLETRVALLWNDEHLFVAYKVEDNDIRGIMTGFNEHVYMHDEDVEIFLEGNGYYYECGINPLNNSYQIKWTWVQRLVEERRYTELEELFKSPDFLYYVAREGEQIGRHADLNYRLPGLQHAVFIDGSLNCPAIKDNGWSVEMAIPWAGLKEILGHASPPFDGQTIRMTAYRAHHDRQLRKVKGWTWSIMGNDNIHIPERWNEITFIDSEA